jgi:hypothetical protein
MSLFDSASLVVTPNGVKEGKLYSIKPTDGSGDLSVTRATTATRVNSAGLVELVPYNLLSYSQDFSNAAWTKQNLTLTSGQTSPIGDNTAFRAQFSGVAYLLQSTSTTAATASVYARATSGTAKIRIGDTNGNFTTQYSLTTEWQRITTSGSANVGVSIDSYVDGGWTTQDVQLWGAQLVAGTSAKDYQKTLTRLNIPRLDYTNGTCPSILVEPQRTNLATYSEQFDNAAWIKGQTTITANNTTAPDGNNTADLLLENTSNSSHNVASNYLINFTSGTSYTTTIYAKNITNGRGFIQIAGFKLGSGATNIYANFNIANGTLGSYSGGTPTIQSMGNGWYRCVFSFTCGNTISERINYSLITASNSTSFQNYTGDASKGVYLWGAQLEAGSYATSYIPTVASSVTRNADVISKTGISSLIGQTEGTMFLDVNVTKDGSGYYPLGTLIGATSSIYIGINTFITTGNIYAEIRNTTQQALISSSINSGRCKIALAYKANDIALYINGNLIGTDTSATIPATSAFSFEYDVSIGNRNTKNINDVILWKTRLTNAELATLTTI